MGYHKNQLIAEQVEEADRIPAPKPATSHVAFPTRRSRKQASRIARHNYRKMNQRIILDAVVYVGIGFLAGITMGVLICAIL